MNRVAIVGLFCLGLMGSITAQEPRTENTWTRGKDFTPAATKIEALDWLAGRWVGEAMGGTTEEIWSPPDQGEMIGMFRFMKDGKTSFYELMTISERDGGLMLRIKHFDANFKGWESQEKFVEFGFLAKRDQQMCFDGLTFASQAEDRMTIYVADEKDGKFSELKFDFTRQPSTVPSADSVKR